MLEVARTVMVAFMMYLSLVMNMNILCQQEQPGPWKLKSQVFCQQISTVLLLVAAPSALKPRHAL